MAGRVRGRYLVVDTYAIIADLTGSAPPAARRALESVRLGDATGVVHCLIVYELAYFWKRTGLIFRDLEEVREFIETYFKVVELIAELALEAAKVKVEGDELLRKASEPSLRARRLSAADATTLALSLKLGAQLVTGDRDLMYVAQRMRVNVIW